VYGNIGPTLWYSRTAARVPLLAPDVGYHSVAFSPDSTLFAAGADDGTIRIWHAVDGGLVRELMGHTRLVSSLVFTQDGSRLISCDDGGEIRIWDLTCRNKPVRLACEGGKDVPTTLSFSRDGRHVFGFWRSSSRRGQLIEVWESATGERVAEFDALTWPYDPASLDFVVLSDDRSRIAAGSVRDGAVVLDADTSFPVERLRFTDRFARSELVSAFWNVMLSGDLRRAVVWLDSDDDRDIGRRRGGVIVCSARDGSVIREFPDLESVGHGNLRLDGDGATLFWHRGPDIVAFDVATGAIKRSIGGLDLQPGVTWKILATDTPRGRFAVASISGSRVLSVDSGATVSLLDDLWSCQDLTFSPAGDRCAAVSGRYLWMWEVTSGRRVFSVADTGTSVAFDPLGDRLVVGDDDADPRIVDTVSRRQRQREVQSQHAATPAGRRAAAVALLAAGDRILAAADSLRADASLSVEVRGAALDALRDTCAGRRGRLRELFDRHVFGDAVVAAIDADASLSPGERADLAEMARLRGDPPYFLRDAALRVVAKRDSSRAEFDVALRAARKAVAGESLLCDDASAWTAVGVAALSTGEDTEAVSAFDRSERLLAAVSDDASEVNLAGLAIAKYRLEEEATAREIFARLTAGFAAAAIIDHDPLAIALFNEAKALIAP
jgi:WD40 repeat protein